MVWEVPPKKPRQKIRVMKVGLYKFIIGVGFAFIPLKGNPQGYSCSHLPETGSFPAENLPKVYQIAEGNWLHHISNYCKMVVTGKNSQNGKRQRLKWSAKPVNARML